MTVCCPLSGNDGEYADAGTVSVRRAAKEHRCYECRKPIAKGTRYEHSSTLYDGRWSTFKTCMLCVEIRTHFECGEGWLYGQLWKDLAENFFPDMRCGGVCMAGLSPAAKAKLIDRRLEWYFDQGEINDSAWEDWPKHKDRQRAPRPSEPLVDDSDDLPLSRLNAGSSVIAEFDWESHV